MSYRGEIQANTQITVKLGPFLDNSDGNTNETGLSISQADIRLSKNGGNFAQVNHNQGGGNLTHDELGYYDMTLDTTDTNTEGRLLVVVHESGGLLVELSFNVIAQAAYTSKFTAKDTGYMDVNVKAVSEDTAAADNLESACDNYSVTRGLSGTALPAAAADAAGGLPVSDTGGLDLDTLDSNVSSILADTGTDGVVVATNNDKTGYGLADDAITSAKYDESTAYPLASADSGSTQVARVGADGDTLETLSDQIDAVPTASEIQTEMEENGASILDTLQDRLGTPADIDGGGATIADNIKKLADDNGGATFDATTDSLTSIRDNELTTIAADVVNIDGSSIPTAANVVDEWETQSQADPTGFHVNVMEVNGTAQTGNDVGADVDTILNRLGDFAGSGLNTVKGFLQAVFRKDAGVTGANTPSEINEAENGTTGNFDGTTDSIEAIRDTAPLGTAMRGTDGANTTVPDAAGTAAGLHATTDGKIDAVQSDVTTIAADVANVDGSSIPTAAEIVNEWESQSQADPTGFHVNVMEVGGTAQTANDNGGDINTLITNLGTPADIDGGGATIADNLKKLADDNAGADFDATSDSLQAIRDRGDSAWTTASVAGLATAANQTTILARLGDFAGSGLNTVKGFLQAVFRKDAGVTGANTPSEINEAENGTAGTFDGTTDSVEAIRDTAPLGTAMRGTDNAALEANVETHVTNSLNSYDPPTKAEVDAAIAALNDPTAAAIATAVVAEAVDGAIDVAEALKVILAVCAGDIAVSGNTYTYKDQSGTNKVTQTVAAASTDRTIL